MSAGKVKLAAGVVVFAVAASGVHHKHHHWSVGVPSALAAVSASASPPNANARLGQRMAAQEYGWRGAQWNCLDQLWTRESGWSNTAENASSGADGIAQALGHGPTNQYPAGPANPPTNDPRAQIRWGLGYIHSTYVTPCGAWAHETANNWY